MTLSLVRVIPEDSWAGEYQFWLFGKTNKEVMIAKSENSETCSLILSEKSQLLLQKVAESLDIPYHFEGGIDSIFIAIPKSDLVRFMDELDRIG